MTKNAVMISIRPKWCELIASGEKTIDIRKNRPRLETPFKCYIYCTSIKYMNLDEYVELHRATGGKIDQWHGKVIGEFVCEKITAIERTSSGLWTGGEPNGKCYAIVEKSMLPPREIYDYAGKNTYVYGWHISDLKIYDEPRILSAFGLNRPPQSWCYVEEMEK